MLLSKRKILPLSTSLFVEWTLENVSLFVNSTSIKFNQHYLDLDAPPNHPATTYDLIVNVTHESVAGTTRDKVNTAWKVHLRAGSGGGESEKWYQIQDLIVEEVRKEMIFLGETVLQVRCKLIMYIFFH